MFEKILTQNQYKFVSYFPMRYTGGKKIRFMSGSIDGTVFSGHPIRTTWGNTLRVILYLKYAFGDSVIYNVAGDDVLINFPTSVSKDWIRERASLVYTKHSHGQYALGQ